MTAMVFFQGCREPGPGRGRTGSSGASTGSKCSCRKGLLLGNLAGTGSHQKPAGAFLPLLPFRLPVQDTEGVLLMEFPPSGHQAECRRENLKRRSDYWIAGIPVCVLKLVSVSPKQDLQKNFCFVVVKHI